MKDVLDVIKLPKRGIGPDKDRKSCLICGGRGNMVFPCADKEVPSITICKTCGAYIYHSFLANIAVGNMRSNEEFNERTMEIAETIKAYDPQKKKIDARSPREIYRELDRMVVGQKKAKKTLSNALYNHLKRMNAINPESISKSNVLLSGPTGSGKTMLAKSLSKIAGVPFAIVDATSITRAGYVGGNVEDMLLTLLQAADGDQWKAEHGIIYVDEIDKIRKMPSEDSREFMGEAVQQAFLKIMEGADVTVSIGKAKMTMNTDNILFIFGGAFVGLEKKEKEKTPTVGFTYPDPIVKKQNDESDEMTAYINYGFIPEFLGRISVIVKLEELSEEDLIHIMKDVKNSVLQQYTNLFLMDNIHLAVPDDVIREVVRRAVQKKTGARGLRAIMDDLLSDIIFDLPFSDDVNVCEITMDTFENKKAVLYLNDNLEEQEETLLGN